MIWPTFSSTLSEFISSSSRGCSALSSIAGGVGCGQISGWTVAPALASCEPGVASFFEQAVRPIASRTPATNKRDERCPLTLIIGPPAFFFRGRPSIPAARRIPSRDNVVNLTNVLQSYPEHSVMRVARRVCNGAKGMTTSDASVLRACANRKRRLAFGVAVASIGVSIAYAIDDLELHIDSVQGPHWQAQGLIAALDLAANAQRARVQIDTLKLAQLPEALRSVVIDCPHVEMSPRAFACREARVVAQVPRLGKQTLRANVRYERSTGALDLDVANVKIGTGRAAVRASLRNDAWDARVVLEEVPLDVLVELSQAAQVPLPAASVTGATSLEVRASGRDSAIRDIHARGSVQQLVASNESGSFATDGLAARFEIALERSQEQWDYEATLVADQGQG